MLNGVLVIGQSSHQFAVGLLDGVCYISVFSLSLCVM